MLPGLHEWGMNIVLTLLKRSEERTTQLFTQREKGVGGGKRERQTDRDRQTDR